MNRAHIPGFPNRIPCIDWKTYLPKFIYGNEDEVVIHLVRFHMHVCKLKIEFPKDFLMKNFMATLEDKARVWYEGLKSRSLCSLKDFHRIVFGHYGKSHPSSPLFQDCFKSSDDDVECMDDEEILEALYEFSSQASFHDDQEIFQQADVSSLFD